MKFIKGNIILLITIVLSLFGILMIYSSSSIWALYKFNNPFKYVFSQSLFFLIGLFIIFLLGKVDYKIYKKYSNIILFICFILLIMVLIPGVGKVRNGSRSWFGVGPFGIQPSEFSKIGLIIFASKYLSNNDRLVKDIKHGIFPILVIIFIIIGLIMLEPDFGQAVVIILSLMMIIFISGTKLSFFIKCGCLGFIGLAFLIIVAPYRMIRIISFINPWVDPLGSGFQIIQSLYAIGPSGLLGKGFGNSIQKHFYLPEPQTDFIFAIISEEFGFLGIIIVSILFLLLFYNCISVSLKSKDLFSKYLSFGLITQIIIQSTLNLAVVTGLIPVTGVTLPFISYGGSSLLVSMISIGIIRSIKKH